MNNETIHAYTIKERAGNFFDIYVDKEFVCSKGSMDSALKMLKEIIEVDKMFEEQKTLHKDILLEVNGAVS